MKTKNKNLKYLIALSLQLLISNKLYAAKIPSCWLNTINCNHEAIIEENKTELDQSISKIFEFKSDLVEETAGKNSPEKKFQLKSIKTELGIEAEGEMGVLAAGGEAALELIWVRNLPPTKEKLNQLTNEVQTENAIDLSEVESENELNESIGHLAEKLQANQKITNKDLFQTTAKKEILKILSLNNLLQQKDDRPWWPYKVQLELAFNAEGGLLQGPTLGGGFRLRLVWNRLKKINGSFSEGKNSLITNNQNLAILDSMNEAFESAYNAFQLNNSINNKYEFNNLKIGIGVGLGGNIYVAKGKGSVITSLFFKRDPQKNNLTGHHLVNGRKSKEYFMPIPMKESQHSFVGESNLTSQINTKVLSTSLKPIMGMASYFAKKADAREQNFIRKGKLPKFGLDFIEIELELFSSGNLGLTTLKGITVMEFFLTKKK